VCPPSRCGSPRASAKRRKGSCREQGATNEATLHNKRVRQQVQGKEGGGRCPAAAGRRRDSPTQNAHQVGTLGKECWEIFAGHCAMASRAQAPFSTSQNATKYQCFLAMRLGSTIPHAETNHKWNREERRYE